MSESSYFVRHEVCPACAKQGRDRSKDNLGVFSDGRKFCFNCRYTEFPNKITSFKGRIAEDNDIDYELPYLPVDCDILYPQRALDWVGQYQLNKTDLYKHNALWSETKQRLIFPVFGDGLLIAWQGRYFGDDPEVQKKQKWWGKGNLKGTFNIINQSNRIVLCEDILSAIKLSKCDVGAMPLYGCQIGRTRFKRLYSLINENDEVMIWLDPDKRREALKEEQIGLLCGINTRVVFSDKDPKEHTYEQIKDILQKGNVC